MIFIILPSTFEKSGSLFMRNLIVLSVVFADFSASCTQSLLVPPNNTKPGVETTSGGGNGGGSGGGGTPGKGGSIPPPQPTNLSIFTKQLIGTWFTSAAVAEGDPTLAVRIILQNGGTYSLSFTDNRTGLTTTGVGGVWQFTIPSNLPIGVNDYLSARCPTSPPSA
jgi:hypothetical protein